jgi:transposase
VPRTWVLRRPSARVTEAERATRERFLHANPLLAQRDRASFDQGLQDAEASDLPSFPTVARSFRQDDAAMIAALTTPWRTGQCEGQMGRVKLMTR